MNEATTLVIVGSGAQLIASAVLRQLERVGYAVSREEAHDAAA